MAKKKETKKANLAHTWLSRIQARERARGQVSGEFRWEHYVDTYKGKWDMGLVGNEIQPLNYMYAYVETEMAAMYLRDPHIEITATKESSIGSAKIKELAANDFIRRKKMKREFKKCLLDAKTVGHGWMKEGFTGDFGTAEDEATGSTIDVIRSQDFFAYRIPWKHVLFNAESIDPPHDSRWIAHEFWRPLDDVKKNKDYKHTEDLQGVPLQGLVQEKGSKKDFMAFGDVPMVRLFEVWDIVELKKYIFAEGVDEGPLHEIEWPKAYFTPEGKPFFPFSYITFNKPNDDAYGIPDMFYFEHLVLEKTKIRHILLDHVKKFGRQMITEEGNLTPESEDAYEAGVTGALLKAKDITKVGAVPYPPAQGDIYPLEDRLNDDTINISGQTPQERGGSQKSQTRTFRELVQMQKGSENRRSKNVDVMEDFIEDVMTKIIYLMKNLGDVPYFVRATGLAPEFIQKYLSGRPSAEKEGSYANQNGFTFTKEDIEGDCDVDVKAGSTTPLDRNNKLSLIFEVILPVLPNMGITPGGPIYGFLGRMIGEEFDMPELEQAINEEIQLQNQMKVQQQEAQDEATQLQISSESAKIGLKAQSEATKQAKVELDAARLALESSQPEPVSEAK